VPFLRDRAGRLFKGIGYETEMVFNALGHEPVDIATVYIGGGTPSLIEPDWLVDYINLIDTYARYMPDYEFSIEANPESLGVEFAERSFEAAVNRLVLGIQSFSVKALKKLNRKVSSKDIYRSFYRARSAGYENIAADLIFGLPGQTMKSLRTDIERLASLEPTHISFYQLTVEANTPLAEKIAGGEIELPDEEQSAAMYRIGSHILIDRKYRRYEVSNFARDGRRSRHNYAYWTGKPYLGLGPGAHGFINGYRYRNLSDIDAYTTAVESGFLPIEYCEKLTPGQKLTETIMLSMRTAEGLDKRQLIDKFGDKGSAVLKGEAVRKYTKAGYLIDDAGFLRLTDHGFLVADKIILDLIS